MSLKLMLHSSTSFLCGPDFFVCWWKSFDAVFFYSRGKPSHHRHLTSVIGYNISLLCCNMDWHSSNLVQNMTFRVTLQYNVRIMTSIFSFFPQTFPNNLNLPLAWCYFPNQLQLSHTIICNGLSDLLKRRHYTRFHSCCFEGCLLFCPW